MGQRANLIIISGGTTEIYYTHHRANTLDHDLFWGPQYAIGFIRAQQPVPTGNLLDEVWAEGGALMDLDQAHLLWFGGEDISCEVPLCRMHQKLMSSLWPGWKIQWASEGVVDVAKYLGLSVSAVLSHQCEPSENKFDAEKLVRPVDEPMWTSLASARFGSGKFGFCRLRSRLENILYAGPAIIDAMKSLNLPQDLSLAGRSPMSGFHIDEAGNCLGFWTAGSCEDVHRRVQSEWPGWTVRWHKDRFESQVERTCNKLHFPRHDPDRLIQELRSTLLRSQERESGVEAAVQIAKMMTGKFDIKEIRLSPAALHDAQLILPLELRTQLFNSAAAAMTQ